MLGRKGKCVHLGGLRRGGRRGRAVSGPLAVPFEQLRVLLLGHFWHIFERIEWNANVDCPIHSLHMTGVIRELRWLCGILLQGQ